MDEQNNNSTEKNAQKIQALRDMISNAEITLQGAKTMLLQLEGKKNPGVAEKLMMKKMKIIGSLKELLMDRS